MHYLRAYITRKLDMNSGKNISAPWPCTGVQISKLARWSKQEGSQARLFYVSVYFFCYYS